MSISYDFYLVLINLYQKQYVGRDLPLLILTVRSVYYLERNIIIVLKKNLSQTLHLDSNLLKNN